MPSRLYPGRGGGHRSSDRRRPVDCLRFDLRAEAAAVVGVDPALAKRAQPPDTEACEFGLMKPTYRAVAAMAINAQTPAERASRRRHRGLLARHRNR
jgi:hypothetical protein